MEEMESPAQTIPATLELIMATPLIPIIREMVIPMTQTMAVGVAAGTFKPTL
jgi:hypothetical protein